MGLQASKGAGSRSRRALAAVVAAALLASCGGGPRIEPGSTLVLDLGGTYLETQAASPLSRLLGDAAQPFVHVLFALGKARRDDRIANVVLRIRDLGVGWGKAQEMRDAIMRLRDAGKPVVAYLELASFSGQLEYFVASAAERVYLARGTTVPLVGLSAQYLYLGGLWEKLGIEFETAQAGRYKSAVESIAGEKMSESSREMANDLLDSVERQFVEGIASGRGLEPREVRERIDQGLVLPAELAGAGLVDGVRHLDELVEELGGARVEAEEFAQVELDVETEASFALVYGSGNVVTGEAGPGLGQGPRFASDTYAKAVSQAAEDDEIDAIIVRIDSPGGSSVAAEQMWRATRRARASGKPVVASFSDVAASGGYYVAAAADAIVSPAGALTGSIGVFALKPTVGGLYDKLGIHSESLTRGRYADFHLSTGSSEDTQDRLQRLALDTYQLFLERVAEGRDLEVAEVDAVAQGRVWTGASAYAKGLVDEVGGLIAAVDVAQAMLGLDREADVLLVPYPPAPSLSQQIADLLTGGLGASLRAGLRGSLRDELAGILPLPPTLQALAESFLMDGSRGGAWLLPPLWVEVR